MNEQLSKQKELIRRHQNAAPVSMVEVTKALGLEAYSMDNLAKNISGLIRKEEDGKYRIYINGAHPAVRQRFTIAHEVAHYVLHRDLIGDGITDDVLWRSGLSSAVEAQANKFAADILMPWHLLQPCIDRQESIEDLAKLFNVSRDAMSIRVLGVPYDQEIMTKAAG